MNRDTLGFAVSVAGSVWVRELAAAGGRRSTTACLTGVGVSTLSLDRSENDEEIGAVTLVEVDGSVVVVDSFLALFESDELPGRDETKEGESTIIPGIWNRPSCNEACSSGGSVN